METVNQSQQSGSVGQSVQTGLYGKRGGLKETGAKTKCFGQRLKRGAAAMDSLRKVTCFLNIGACKASEPEYEKNMVKMHSLNYRHRERTSRD